MLKIFFFILLGFFTESISAQNFEGRITYRLSCKSNLKDYANEQICSGVPNKLEYFIKNGEYKFNSADTSNDQWMLYINKENRIYNKMPGNDTIYWRAGSDISDTVVEVRTIKKATMVLGLECDEIIFICTDQVHTFYYNSKISVDQNLFINHKYGNLYNFFKKSNSLILKEVVESMYSNLENVATEIKPMKIDEDFFQVPVNSVVVKNPY